MAFRLRLVVAATLALGVAAATAPAYAATGSPPVTAPDTVTVRAGEPTTFDVVGNDTDPDGDDVQLCRLGPTPRRLGPAFISDGELTVFPMSKAQGHTFTLTYYACDTSYLTPGTVTVKVRGTAPSLDVIPVHDLPGKVRIVNTYRHRSFHCEWHELGEQRVEGRTTVPPRSSVVVTVHESNVEFECTSGNLTIGFGFATAEGRPGVTRLPS